MTVGSVPAIVSPPAQPTVEEPAPTGRAAARLRATLGAYLALTKPRIIELLLVTTVPAMLLAQRGMPSVALVAATLVGGALAAGSANSLNCYLDRDIDELMRRTRRRPLPRHSVPPVNARRFGILLGIAATAVFALAVNLLSAALAVLAILSYVVGYTWLLKRRTPSNIVWGGAAGCFPVLIGWSAVTGHESWTAAILFLIVFFWTPPHFWALALRYREDYAAAAVPMLPVVATPTVVTNRMLRYAVATVATTLVLAPVAHLGWGYAAVAGGLGAVLLSETMLLHRRTRTNRSTSPMRLFHWSNSYLALVFTAAGVAAVVR